MCGRIIGEARDTTDAFNRILPGQNTIEENYVDGVSITHGASGLHTHIWTLGAGVFNHNGIVGFTRCPCDISDRNAAPLPPAEVGNNYFCDNIKVMRLCWCCLLKFMCSNYRFVGTYVAIASYIVEELNCKHVTYLRYDIVEDCLALVRNCVTCITLPVSV